MLLHGNSVCLLCHNQRVLYRKMVVMIAPVKIH